MKSVTVQRQNMVTGEVTSFELTPDHADYTKALEGTGTERFDFNSFWLINKWNRMGRQWKYWIN